MGKRYSIEDVNLWAEEYKICGSIKLVAEKFNVSVDTVRNRFKQSQSSLNILLPRDKNIRKDGKRYCRACETYKEENVNNFYKNNDRFYTICIDCVKQNTRDYVLNNYDIVMERNKIYSQSNPEKIREIKLRWKKNHPNYKPSEETKLKNNTRGKKWRKKNKYQVNAKRNDRRNNDPQYRLSCVLRTRLSQALNGSQKVGSTIKDLGCSLEELKHHLESKFYHNPETKEMMSWENYGLYGWHVDHIIPLVSFDLTDRSQLLQACHYTNLQPLWAKENLKKGRKIIGET